MENHSINLRIHVRGSFAKDTYIETENPNSNFNNSLNLFVGSGVTRGATRFITEYDISPILSGSIIENAYIRFDRRVGDSSSLPGKMRRLTEMNWDSSAVTWNTYDGINPWIIPGGDFTTVNEVNVDFDGLVGDDVLFDVKDLIVDAIDSRNSRLILIFMADDETIDLEKGWGASESNIDPRLDINFLPPSGYDDQGKIIGTPVKIWTIDDSPRDHIRKSDRFGQNIELVLSGVAGPIQGAHDYLDDKIYVAHNAGNTIRRFNTDGSDVEIISSETGVKGVKLDRINRKLYYTHSLPNGQESVNRMNYDGTNVEVLITNNDISMDQPQAIGLDIESGILFYADTQMNAILRADTNGSGANVQVIHSGAGTSEFGFIVDIEVDTVNKMIYFANSNANNFGIYRSDYDGNNFTSVYKQDAAQILGIAIDFERSLMYFTDDGSNRHRLQYFDIDLNPLGNNRAGQYDMTILDNVNASGDLNTPFGLWLEFIEPVAKMFVDGIASPKIERSNLDGTNRQAFFIDI